MISAQAETWRQHRPQLAVLALACSFSWQPAHLQQLPNMAFDPSETETLVTIGGKPYAGMSSRGKDIVQMVVHISVPPSEMSGDNLAELIEAGADQEMSWSILDGHGSIWRPVGA